MKQNMKEAIGLSLKRYNDTYMKATNDRIDNIVSQAGTDNTEIVDARIDSAGVTHTTLNNRILAETKMNDQHLVSCSGEHITAENTMGGSITNLEVLGNTIQNEEDLADIKSVGVLQEDGTYKMSILSCGKNLANPSNIINDLYVNGTASTIQTVEGARSICFKVKANTTYIISFDKSVPRNMVGVTSGIPKSGDNCDFLSVNTVELTKRFSFSPKTSGYALFYYSNVPIEVNIQLEEGTVATPYEPYQENKCDILLPCQLEKVGDVADRLYYDDVEKAWCVEKNVGTDMLETYDWQINRSHTNCIAYQTTTQVPNMAKNRLGMCLGFITDFSWEDSKHYHNGVYEDVTRHIITIPRTEVETPTALKQYLSSNNIYAKYQLATPQKIVLPLSTQIQLNSFFGTTHVYMESGEVEGTIKCKIPKSIGATVQSLNNKTDILSDRIEAIEGLKDSQNMKYETDKGYLVCKETKNGVIDDLKIEGKTLVNLFNNSTVKFQEEQNRLQCTNDENRWLYKKGVYTIVNLCDKTVTPNIYTTNPKTWIKALNVPGNSSITINLEENQSICEVVWLHSFGWTSSDLDKVRNGLVILEGDHTQNPPSYFEGLMSVGQDVDKIEVLSRKEDGNLLDIKDIKGYFGNSPSYNEGVITGGYGIEIHPNNLFLTKGTYIFSFELDRKTDSVVDYYTIAFCGYNSENILGNIVINTLNNGICTKTITIDRDINVKYIKFDCRSQRANTTVSKICLSKTSNHTYIPHQSDKKQILFYNENGELEPIQELHEWDSIEKHSDNKWYYHKRSGKVVLNGSENWSNYDSLDACTPYLVEVPKINFNHAPISDKFVGGIFDGRDGEKICVGGSPHIIIQKDNSTLSIQDVQGFKQWLQANNVTVVYQLAQEEVYELAPLHLDSYANETLILCNSGAISPKMEFSITSHINELVKAYGERVNLLEEKVYQYMVTQNRMQLASTYSADSVTFKVDYFSLCGDEENYNEDLYNLILNNILVGKDNYDYDKMFTMILDYASWNQISWEQFDILVGLMDIQHNPPAEEFPTEDIIEEDIIENETPVE